MDDVIAFSLIDFDAIPFDDTELVDLLGLGVPLILEHSDKVQFTDDVMVSIRKRRLGSSSASSSAAAPSVTIHVTPISENVECIKGTTQTALLSEKKINVVCEYSKSQCTDPNVTAQLIRIKRIMN